MAAAEKLTISPLIDPAHYAAHGYPHELWTRLRREDPVHRVEQNPEMPFWAITRHADIATIGKQPEHVPERHHPADPHRAAAAGRGDVPEDADRDGSAQARGVPQDRLASASRRGALKRWHADIDRIGKEIVDDLLATGDQGEVRLRREGLRAAADRGDRVAARRAPLRLEAALRLDEPHDRRRRPRVPDGGRGRQRHRPPGDDRAVHVLREARRGEEEEPGGRPRHPLRARPRWTARSSPMMDVLAYCLIIVVAGNETTRNATSGGMLALDRSIPRSWPKTPEEPGAAPERDRGDPALDEPDHPLRAHRHAGRRAPRQAHPQGRRSSRSSIRRPTATRTSSTTPSSSASTATRTATSPSASASTSAPARTWRGSSSRWRSSYLLPRLDELELAGPVSRLHSNLVGGIKHLPIRYKLRPA